MSGIEMDRNTMRDRGWSIHSEASTKTEELDENQKRELLESFPSDPMGPAMEYTAKDGSNLARKTARSEQEEDELVLESAPLSKKQKTASVESQNQDSRLLDIAKSKLSKWAARLFDPNRPRGLVEPPQTIPLNDEFLQAFGKREKAFDEALGREIEIDQRNLDDREDGECSETDTLSEGEELGTAEGRKIKITNLAYTTTQETLQKACDAFGPTVEVILVMDKETLNSSKPMNVGRAYVTFEKASSAELCIERLTKLDGRPLRITMAASDPVRSRKSSGGTRTMARYWAKDISTKCFRCGEVGHLEANCTNEAKPKPCSLCGQTDHDMRDCSYSKICFRCGLPGHVNRECMRQNLPKRMLCGICLQSGHHRVSCRRRMNDTLAADAICMVCGNKGHYMCEDMKWFFGLKGVSCFNCGQKGHLGYDCDRPLVDFCIRDEEVGRREVERAASIAVAEELQRQRGRSQGRRRNERRDDWKEEQNHRNRGWSLPPERGYRGASSGNQNHSRRGSRGYNNVNSNSGNWGRPQHSPQGSRRPNR